MMKQILHMTVLALTALLLSGLSFAHAKEQRASKPLKIYILAGQSNMQGKARCRTIERLNMTEDSQPLYTEMMGEDGNPVTVKDAYGVYFTSGRGGDAVHRSYGRREAFECAAVYAR